MPRNMTPERDCNVTKTPQETARLERQAKAAARYPVKSGNEDIADILGISEHIAPGETRQHDTTDKEETS